MMTSKHFYDFPTNSGLKTVNVLDIALLESVDAGVKITLSVTDNKGHSVVFISELPWPIVSAQIHSMSDQL